MPRSREFYLLIKLMRKNQLLQVNINTWIKSRQFLTFFSKTIFQVQVFWKIKDLIWQLNFCTINVQQMLKVWFYKFYKNVK